MNTPANRRLHGSWALVAWLVLIASGGLMTSLLRAPHVLSNVVPLLVISHLIGGTVVAIAAIAGLIYARGMTRWWRLMLVAAVPLSGWLAHRSFSPRQAAAHAALAAFAIIALTTYGFGSRHSIAYKARPLTLVLSRVGFGSILVQLAAGAALRHHVIGLAWHLFIGGLATMAVLGSAVPTTQDQQSTLAEKRAAATVVAAILVQVSLGTAVLFMILLGPPNDVTWISATVAHVLVGSVTLLAVSRFCCGGAGGS
jgi:hypothetical protein